MITLETKALFQIGKKHGLTEKEVLPYRDQVEDYLSLVKKRKQGFADILEDEALVIDIYKYVEKVKHEFNHVVVLGIGGSALGLKSVVGALHPLFSATPTRLSVLDNIDPDVMGEITEELEWAKTLFIVISKSGRTPETLSQYFYFWQRVENYGLDPREHFAVITGKSGFLREEAETKNLPVFSIPENVGGRFSVLTAVGLVPAALVGVDIVSLLNGAAKVRDLFLNKNFDQNICFQLALYQFLLSQKGKTQTVLMPYASKLKLLSEWYAQLLAESTGKIDASGKNVGLTPIGAVGVTDQHSQLQLYAEGPNDKLICAVRVEHFPLSPQIPVNLAQKQPELAWLAGVDFHELLHTELRATLDALSEKERPNLVISVPQISAESLGGLFLLFEGATAFLGEFLEINAFDQPGVERSKVLTREYLSERR